MRMHVLEELGHAVTPIDTKPKHVRNRETRIAYRALQKLVGQLDLGGANAAIVDHVRSAPFDVLWLDKALTISSRTFRAVKLLQPNCQIIGYSLDDMNARHNQTRRFLNNLPLYDAFFTTKTYGVAELRALGCRRVEFTGNAFEAHTHRPVELTDEERRFYGGDVGFVGTFEEDRAQQMTYLAEHGIEVHVIGNDWRRWPNPHPRLRIKSEGIYGAGYPKAVCATKINLCFLRKINRDLQTTRSVEIPACGGFMLAERTDEHLTLFEEGKEAEFFSSKEELLEKVRHYLAHEGERERIAAAGRERCLRSGYSYHDRLRKILLQIDETPSDADRLAPAINARG